MHWKTFDIHPSFIYFCFFTSNKMNVSYFSTDWYWPKDIIIKEIPFKRKIESWSYLLQHFQKIWKWQKNFMDKLHFLSWRLPCISIWSIIGFYNKQKGKTRHFNPITPGEEHTMLPLQKDSSCALVSNLLGPTNW